MHVPACHARRPHLALQLSRQGLRVWTTDDGYALLSGGGRRLQIVELVSASGDEASMIRALLDWTRRGELWWELPSFDGERLARLMPYAANWGAGGVQMIRIVDLAALLSLFQPVLSRRAAPLRDMALAIGMREHDRTDVATIVVTGGKLEVRPGREASRYIEWSAPDAARLILGGPPDAASVDGFPELAALFPLPVYVPTLDRV